MSKKLKELQTWYKLRPEIWQYIEIKIKNKRE